MPNDQPETTVRVRILVAVDHEGKWTATGISWWSDKEMRENAFVDDLADGERYSWVGEITRAAHADGGEDAAALGDDGGWWLMLYPDHVPLAKFVNAERAREFFAHMEEAVRGR